MTDAPENQDQTPPFYDRYGFQLDPVFPDSAPRDAMLALGCNRSFVLVVPSLDLVTARAGGDCVSIENGTPQLTDEARAFVTASLAGVSPSPTQVPMLPDAALGLLVACLVWVRPRRAVVIPPGPARKRLDV